MASCRETPGCPMSTMPTSSFTERSPPRSASMRRRRVGSARIWKASGTPIHYSNDICLVNDIFPILAPDAQAEEHRQLVEGSCRGANRPSPTFPAQLPSLTDHIEHALHTVDGEVEATDNAVAVQQRHHEVPPSLAFGHVDLELEVESPEGQGPVAIANEVVEGRQQCRPGLERPCLDPTQPPDV